MKCPNCDSENFYVIETRSRDADGIIRRRRRCADCGHTFRTYEVTVFDLKKLETRSQLFGLRLTESGHPNF